MPYHRAVRDLGTWRLPTPQEGEICDDELVTVSQVTYKRDSDGREVLAQLHETRCDDSKVMKDNATDDKPYDGAAGLAAGLSTQPKSQARGLTIVRQRRFT